MKVLSTLIDNIDKNSFYIEKDGKKIKYKDIMGKINLLINNLRSISEWDGMKVYVDIKDRILFVYVFFALLKLRSKIVLIPAEIKSEDYVYSSGLFISDNKELKQGLYIMQDLKVKTGIDFDLSNLEKPLDNKIVLYLYTSGSTGKVKLIPKSDENIITELEELKKILSIKNDNIFYFTPPLYHIYGMLFGLLLPLYCSAKIIIDYNFTPESISDFVQKKKVSHFISIPSYYKMFNDLDLFKKFNECNKLISSSALLPIEISRKFYDNELKITEIYGSTETGGIAFRTSAKSLEWKLFSYVKILKYWDEYLESGSDKLEKIELRISSPTISIDYDNTDGYNTGDIVDLYPDNKFMLLGRNTRFVKISGKRVNLHYVQEKLREYLQKEMKVKISEDEIYVGEKEQKLYVIIEKEISKDQKKIKDELKKHLPGYAIPRNIYITKIPRNNMGKINKKKIDELIST